MLVTLLAPTLPQFSEQRSLGLLQDNQEEQWVRLQVSSLPGATRGVMRTRRRDKELKPGRKPHTRLVSPKAVGQVLTKQ